MRVELDYQLGEGVGSDSVPSEADILRWVSQALDSAGVQKPEVELTVRVVSEREIAALNQQYRHKTGPTNVLSFPFESPAELDLNLLGDIVICSTVVEREAAEQGKAQMSHWAHMVVHGVLHLLGYDHIQESHARQMENLETAVLAEFGYQNPYQPVK